MRLVIEVERHKGEWFSPYIIDHPWGCTYHLHEDDITEDGAAWLAEVLTQQALRWKPRKLDAPRGPRIPVWMELEPEMERGCVIVVDDQPTYIRYVVRTGLIKRRAADTITRQLSDRSPDWERQPAQYVAHEQQANV
jgi:hypothetical protein